MEAASLARTWARARAGSSAPSAREVSRKRRRTAMGAFERKGGGDPGRARPLRSSAVPRVDRVSDLVQRLAVLVKPVDETALPLADVTDLRHRVALVAGEQRVVPGRLGAAALAADAVHDFRDLAHQVEHRNGLRMVGELFLGEHVRGGYAGPRRGVGPGCRMPPSRGPGRRHPHEGGGEGGSAYQEK